jgi:hypothetical protein
METPSWRNVGAAMAQRRWQGAMGLALASDAASFGLDAFGMGLGLVIQVGVDLATAALLILILGFRWTLAVPLVVEAIPGLALFPTWTLAVAADAAVEKESDTKNVSKT